MTTEPSTKLAKLRDLLRELFQLDQADLDFGIYRIMNQKREEVERFLDSDLLPQVRTAFEKYRPADKAALQAELDKLITGINAAGMNPEESPKVKELRERLTKGIDVAALEDEVFSDLFTFFRRYYHGGDFLSLRRYKEGVYAIPYEGEEVKLHWANHDQYYIKSSEHLTNYAFKVGPADKQRRVRFELVAAGAERDNNKAASGNERRFILADEDPVIEDGGDLVVRFEYRLDADKRKQEALNSEAASRVFEALADLKDKSWQSALSLKVPTKKNAERTLLDKHLRDYTAKNTFDYFIHKDLGGFLRRELDFFIKNEILLLDDIDQVEDFARVEEKLSKIRVLRAIAHKIIKFLAQLEDFQKKLWLKKKFVVETNWCITLDRIPEEFYPEIAANEAQREEWVRLFAIDEIEGDMVTPGYSAPLTVDFIKSQPQLVVDTRLFEDAFRERLNAAVNETSNALINAENSQALRALTASSERQVAFVYIDPPYNTGSDGFVYKDNYQHSSWCALMHDRLERAHAALRADGCIAVSIDQVELPVLRMLLDSVFGAENLISTITVKRASVTGHKAINPGVVNISEFVLLYAKDRNQWTGNQVYSERERDDRYNRVIVNIDAHHADWEFTSLLEAFSEERGIEKRKLRKVLGDNYHDQLNAFVYRNAPAVTRLARVSSADVGADFRAAVLESKAQPDTVVRFEREHYSDVYLLGGERILFYTNKMMKVGDRLATAEKASDIWVDVLPNDLHNEGGVELKKGKKPETLIARLSELGSAEGDLVLDFFAGSATTLACALKMNRSFLGVEVADYFEDIPLRRLKNVLHGESRGVSRQFGWQGGGAFKYIRLESYEDALDNLQLRERTEPQQQLLAASPEAREDYMLSYMLDVETAGSASLLNIEQFKNPFEYKLKVTRNNETRVATVDLVETFNYLIGLRVDHMAARVHRTAEFERDEHGRLQVKGKTKACEPGEGWTFRVIQGRSPEKERTLVIWRVLTGDPEKDNLMLDTFCKKMGFSTKDMEFDLIYVNGDNNLENLRRDEDTWKVRLIEQDFHRLMFDVRDV